MLQCMYRGSLKWSYSLTQSYFKGSTLIQENRIHMNDDTLNVSRTAKTQKQPVPIIGNKWREHVKKYNPKVQLYHDYHGIFKKQKTLCKNEINKSTGGIFFFRNSCMSFLQGWPAIQSSSVQSTTTYSLGFTI